jgi:hypothetical protein
MEPEHIEIIALSPFDMTRNISRLIEGRQNPSAELIARSS